MKTPHIAYADGVLRIVDQTKLPRSLEVVELRDVPAIIEAIRSMRVRGAPAIGIAAAYGVAVSAHHAGSDSMAAVEADAAAISAARPTAVNLAWAVQRALAAGRRALSGEAGPNPQRGVTSWGAVIEAIEREAVAIHQEDVERCKRIGDYGAALIPDGAVVLTHCNTGDFATGGYGTALGIIRSAFREGRLRRVLVGETRPLLQGARLTTIELRDDNIPFSLIADGMAGYFMQRGEVNAVVVGADRIARNGDTANKIGTYGLAVLARAHDIPFIVAAPVSTFDPSIASGKEIVIEQREPRELTALGAAPDGTPAENPAFDVTPAHLITAIVTDEGVLRPPYESSIAGLAPTDSLPAGAR